MTTEVTEALRNEIARVRDEVIPRIEFASYETIGGPSRVTLRLLRYEVGAAETALAKDDEAAMREALQKLRGCE